MAGGAVSIDARQLRDAIGADALDAIIRNPGFGAGSKVEPITSLITVIIS